MINNKNNNKNNKNQIKILEEKILEEKIKQEKLKQEKLKQENNNIVNNNNTLIKNTNIEFNCLNNNCFLYNNKKKINFIFTKDQINFLSSFFANILPDLTYNSTHFDINNIKKGTIVGNGTFGIVYCFNDLKKNLCIKIQKNKENYDIENYDIENYKNFYKIIKNNDCLKYFNYIKILFYDNILIIFDNEIVTYTIKEKKNYNLILSLTDRAINDLEYLKKNITNHNNLKYLDDLNILDYFKDLYKNEKNKKFLFMGDVKLQNIVYFLNDDKYKLQFIDLEYSFISSKFYNYINLYTPIIKYSYFGHISDSNIKINPFYDYICCYLSLLYFILNMNYEELYKLSNKMYGNIKNNNIIDIIKININLIINKLKNKVNEIVLKKLLVSCAIHNISMYNNKFSLNKFYYIKNNNIVSYNINEITGIDLYNIILYTEKFISNSKL